MKERKVNDTIDDSSPEAGRTEETVKIRRGDLAKTLKETPSVPDSDDNPDQVLQPAHIADDAGNDIEIFSDNLELFADEFRNLPDEIRTRAYWSDIKERLLANNSLKLHMVEDMQGEGQLFGVDEEGRALFKDRGTHPVMYGYGKANRLIRIYDRDKNTSQMARIQKWATGEDIRKLVKRDGYELFKDDGKRRESSSPSFGLGDEMKMITAGTNKPFIACKSHNLMSWVESDDGSGLLALHAAHSYRTGHVDVIEIGPSAANDKIGVIRLFRV